jgi:hypothetical protein
VKVPRAVVGGSVARGSVVGGAGGAGVGGSVAGGSIAGGSGCVSGHSAARAAPRASKWSCKFMRNYG